MSSPRQALAELQAGNRRFVDAAQRSAPLLDRTIADAASGRPPLAVILGCSDARVPPEVVFQQGLGDLFVIRVAGNVVAPAGLESVAFAATELGAPLVVVLGHTGCLAVAAALQELAHPPGAADRPLGAVTDLIRPALTPSGDGDPQLAAVWANVRASVARLLAGSPTLARRVEAAEVMVVGAVYSLETGAVAWEE